MNKQIRVSPNGSNGWKVKQPDNSRASAIVNTKAEAIKTAQQIAKNQWLETKIQNLNWRISSGNSYWNDPFPPVW